MPILTKPGCFYKNKIKKGDHMIKYIRRFCYNTWYFYKQLDGYHDVRSYVNWMRTVM